MLPRYERALGTNFIIEAKNKRFPFLRSAVCAPNAVCKYVIKLIHLIGANIECKSHNQFQEYSISIRFRKHIRKSWLSHLTGWERLCAGVAGGGREDGCVSACTGDFHLTWHTAAHSSGHSKHRRRHSEQASCPTHTHFDVYYPGLSFQSKQSLQLIYQRCNWKPKCANAAQIPSEQPIIECIFNHSTAAATRVHRNRCEKPLTALPLRFCISLSILGNTTSEFQDIR